MASVKNLRNHVRYPSNASACYVIQPDPTLFILQFTWFWSHDINNVVLLPLPCTWYFDIIPKMRKNNEKIITLLKPNFVIGKDFEIISGILVWKRLIVHSHRPYSLSSLEYDICSISTRMSITMFDPAFFFILWPWIWNLSKKY